MSPDSRKFGLRYCRGAQVRHCAALIGTVSGGPLRKRTTASERAQKLLVPALLSTGVATTTYSRHRCVLHSGPRMKRYPDFVHHLPAVQLAFANVESSKAAWLADGVLGSRSPGPSEARSRAKPRSG